VSRKKPAGPFEGLRAMKEQMQKRDGTSGPGDGAGAPAPKKPPAPPKPAPTPDEDALVMHRLYAGVEPLDRSGGQRLPKQQVDAPPPERKAARAREAAQADAEAVRERMRALVEGRARFEVSDDGRRVEGRRLDVPAETVRKLRRGLHPVDARLDLHGMLAGEAKAQVELFLRTMRARGERCVLVIHGKGQHSPGGSGVLRGEIAAWLSQGASSEQVAAFATAADADGGEGAVYVLLSRG
jgi:DNA-nicking Smr family endonuclease